MPGTPHEVLIVALRDRPALLADLLFRLAGLSVSAPVGVLDATVRFTKAIEVRPDLLLRTREPGWMIVEVQNAIDERKRRSWPLTVSLLLHEEKVLGELLVITASRRVAAWAKRAAHLRSALGTRLELTPRVLLLAGPRLDALLDPARPELALFAAWAMHRRSGPAARKVVLRAIELTDKLTDEPLRDAQARAILAVLSEAMLAWLRETAMDASKIPESPAARRFRLFFEKRGRAEGKAEGRAEGKAEGRAEGKQEDLLTILAARDMSLTDKERARVAACTNADQLDRWIKRAITAASTRDVFAAEPQRPARRAPETARARSTERAPRKGAGSKPPRQKP